MLHKIKYTFAYLLVGVIAFAMLMVATIACGMVTIIVLSIASHFINVGMRYFIYVASSIIVFLILFKISYRAVNFVRYAWEYISFRYVISYFDALLKNYDFRLKELSPKYELNPTFPICFFCRKRKGNIAFLGKIGNDEKAHHEMILDYQPCSACLKKMKHGITLIGVTGIQPEDNRPMIAEGLYPTNRWMVIKKKSLNMLFSDKNTIEKIKKKGAAFVDDIELKSLMDQLEP